MACSFSSFYIINEITEMNVIVASRFVAQDSKAVLVQWHDRFSVVNRVNFSPGIFRRS